MNSRSWRIKTLVLDSRGRASSAQREVDVDATRFEATGWKHVINDHIDHPGWADVLPMSIVKSVLSDAARQNKPTPEASRAISDLMIALCGALTRTMGRPHFVETEEIGYPILLSDLGMTRSVRSRQPIESRRGLVAVDESGLTVILRDQELSTAYFPQGTEHLPRTVRFRQAALIARRKANLGAYHDPKYDRYWQHTEPPCFHDVEAWARSTPKRREASHDAR